MRAVYLDEPLASEARDQLDTMNYTVPDKRSPWPALRCGVDAVHSKIAKTHPRCRVLTEDGDWELQNRAESLTSWLDGEFDRQDMEALTERVFHDCLIYGTGAIYVGVKNDYPCAERTYVGDLMVDRQEEVHDSVRSLYRVRRMDAGVLTEMFPKHKAAIEKAKKAEVAPTALRSNDTVCDVVIAVEAWRLADSSSKRGRHTIVVDGATLLDDREWKGDRFPFAFVHWSRDPMRFWGIGLVEQMLQPQGELDEIAKVNSDARHLMVPCLFAEEGTQLDTLENVVGKVYKFPLGRTAPVVSYPGQVHMVMAQMEDIYIQRVWNLAGISQLSAKSEKPKGADSGIALQNLTDIESERFAAANKSWERLHIDWGKLDVAAAEDICASDASKAKKLQVMGGSDTLESITYADCRFADRPSVIRVFPTSQFSNSLAAKIDEIEKLVSAQMIPDIDDARELIDIPDLKRYNTVTGASRTYVRKVVDKALRYGDATSPDPYMGLPYFIKYASLSVNLAALKGCPESHVQCLRDMVQAAIEMRQELAAAAAPPPQAAPAGPAVPPMGGPPPMPPGPPMGPQPMPGPVLVPPVGA